jgi:hypothetical protein
MQTARPNGLLRFSFLFFFFLLLLLLLFFDSLLAILFSFIFSHPNSRRLLDNGHDHRVQTRIPLRNYFVLQSSEAGSTTDLWSKLLATSGLYATHEQVIHTFILLSNQALSFAH